MHGGGIRWAVVALVVAACSSSRGGGAGSGPPADAGTVDAPAAEAGGGDDAAVDGDVVYPGFEPAMPHIEKGTLGVMARPVVIPVYFPGEALQPELDGALSSWLGGSGFQATVSEYGILSASAGTSIVLTETPATSLTDATIDTWLQGELDGSNPAFGAVDAVTLGSEIFVLYYPSTTTITLGGNAQSCTSFSGFHEGTTLASGAVASYVAVPRCPAATSQAQVTQLTITTSALVVSAAANPVPNATPTATGWAGFDPAHLAFGDIGGDEIGNACDVVPPATPAGVTSSIARVWSNVAAAAYHDPCQPSPGGVYYNSVPVVSDAVTVGGVSTTGILVPRGGSKTVDVQLFSDGPTAPWSVYAYSTDPVGFDYALDRPMGQNGETLKLTVTAPASAQQDSLLIVSGTADAPASFWVVAVQSQ